MEEEFVPKKINSTRVSDFPSDYCISEKEKFTVNEMEIFQIIYE